MRALVGAHFIFIGRLLRRLDVPENDVDDAVQQVFIVASKRLAEIPEGSERTFLFGTALRVASTCRRTLRRRGKMDVGALDRQVDHSPCAEELLARRQGIAILDRLVATMADELRAVFTLCELEELTVPQAAALQRIPVGTAASRLRRARKEIELRAKRAGARRHPAHQDGVHGTSTRSTTTL
jgi:RNA polymerase sigma-70 factor (ECF subfamily)